MGGCGPFNNPPESPETRKKRQEQEAHNELNGSGTPGWESRARLTHEGLRNYANFIDIKKLADSKEGLEEIANTFKKLEDMVGSLAFNISFNGGVLKVLPALVRWREGFLAEAKAVEGLIESASKSSSGIAPKARSRKSR